MANDKRFVCWWSPEHYHVDDGAEEVRAVSFSQFSPDLGYGPGDIAAVDALAVDQTVRLDAHPVFGSNHTVTRVR